MAAEVYDQREYQSTYFALRVGLIFASVLVLFAPLSQWFFNGDLPPSISDSWYTTSQMVFVLGLAAASGLLIVIRGDTLTEQTLLNIAGGLGLVVAGVACWPKDDDGNALPNYDPDVAEHNKYVLGALLVLAVVVLLAGRLLPKALKGTDWKVAGPTRVILKSAFPAVIAFGWYLFLFKRQYTAEHLHGKAAPAMFVLLGIVALLRTSRGVRLLAKLRDLPVDDSLTVAARPEGEALGAKTATFDKIYSGVAVGMIVVVVVDIVLTVREVRPGWVVIVESTLLALFGVFWGTQTREAWSNRDAVGQLSVSPSAPPLPPSPLAPVETVAEDDVTQ